MATVLPLLLTMLDVSSLFPFNTLYWTIDVAGHSENTQFLSDFLKDCTKLISKSNVTFKIYGIVYVWKHLWISSCPIPYPYKLFCQNSCCYTLSGDMFDLELLRAPVSLKNFPCQVHVMHHLFLKRWCKKNISMKYFKHFQRTFCVSVRLLWANFLQYFAPCTECTGWDWFHPHMPWRQHDSKAKSDFYWHISFPFWKKIAHACPLLKYLRFFLQACQCKLSCFDGNLISTRCSLKCQHLEIVAIKTMQNHSFPTLSHMHKSKVNAIWNQMLALVSSP